MGVGCGPSFVDIALMTHAVAGGGEDLSADATGVTPLLLFVRSDSTLNLLSGSGYEGGSRYDARSCRCEGGIQHQRCRICSTECCSGGWQHKRGGRMESASLGRRCKHFL